MSNILSDITVHMKYAKYVPELNRRETWSELVDRNIEMHKKKYPNLIDEIDEAYSYVYAKKILPSMRSLQFAGKPIEISPNRLYNCSYLPADSIDTFSEIMFLLLSGCGVGYSVQKHHVKNLPAITKPFDKRSRRFVIGDSIEGWSDAVKVLVKSYLGQKRTSKIVFDYTDIRPKGARLVTSGGKAPGPQPLKECILKIKGILEAKEDGTSLTTVEAHDIVCHIADSVLAGGIRRAALISLFSAEDSEMISCKSGTWWEKNPQRGRANNSAVLMRHKVTQEFFMDLWKRVELSGSGEPGIYFNNDKDWGTNPCCEIALRPFQFCNLCEVNASDLESQEDFNERVKHASFIGTLQAGYTDFHYLRDIWRDTTEKDALIGVSMTGIASAAVLPLDMKAAASIVKRENTKTAKAIGINPAAARNALIADFLSDGLIGLKDLTQDDVKETFASYAKRTDGPFPIPLTVLHKKRLWGLVLVVKDILRSQNEVGFNDEFERESFLQEISEAIRRDGLRSQMQKIGESS